MDQISISLIGGLIGAIIGSISTIGFTIWRDNKIRTLSLAREKLEKVYAPLVALKKKIDLVHQSKGGFLRPSNPMEIDMVEKIIFNYYHLVDDDLKEGLILLHPELNKHTTNMVKTIQLKVEENIFKHYEENKKILGLE
jgi:gas vesicle protein